MTFDLLFRKTVSENFSSNDNILSRRGYSVKDDCAGNSFIQMYLYLMSFIFVYFFFKINNLIVDYLIQKKNYKE